MKKNKIIIKKSGMISVLMLLIIGAALTGIVYTSYSNIKTIVNDTKLTNSLTQSQMKTWTGSEAIKQFFEPSTTETTTEYREKFLGLACSFEQNLYDVIVKDDVDCDGDGTANILAGTSILENRGDTKESFANSIIVKQGGTTTDKSTLINTFSSAFKINGVSVAGTCATKLNTLTVADVKIRNNYLFNDSATELNTCNTKINAAKPNFAALNVSFPTNSVNQDTVNISIKSILLNDVFICQGGDRISVEIRGTQKDNSKNNANTTMENIFCLGSPGSSGGGNTIKKPIFTNLSDVVLMKGDLFIGGATKLKGLAGKKLFVQGGVSAYGNPDLGGASIVATESIYWNADTKQAEVKDLFSEQDIYIGNSAIFDNVEAMGNVTIDGNCNSHKPSDPYPANIYESWKIKKIQANGNVEVKMACHIGDIFAKGNVSFTGATGRIDRVETEKGFSKTGTSWGYYGELPLIKKIIATGQEGVNITGMGVYTDIFTNGNFTTKSPYNRFIQHADCGIVAGEPWTGTYCSAGALEFKNVTSTKPTGINELSTDGVYENIIFNSNTQINNGFTRYVKNLQVNGNLDLNEVSVLMDTIKVTGKINFNAFPGLGSNIGGKEGSYLNIHAGDDITVNHPIKQAINWYSTKSIIFAWDSISSSDKTYRTDVNLVEQINSMTTGLDFVIKAGALKTSWNGSAWASVDPTEQNYQNIRVGRNLYAYAGTAGTANTTITGTTDSCATYNNATTGTYPLIPWDIMSSGTIPLANGATAKRGMAIKGVMVGGNTGGGYVYGCGTTKTSANQVNNSRKFVETATNVAGTAVGKNITTFDFSQCGINTTSSSSCNAWTTGVATTYNIKDMLDTSLPNKNNIVSVQYKTGYNLGAASTGANALVTAGTSINNNTAIAIVYNKTPFRMTQLTTISAINIAVPTITMPTANVSFSSLVAPVHPDPKIYVDANLFKEQANFVFTFESGHMRVKVHAINGLDEGAKYYLVNEDASSGISKTNMLCKTPTWESSCVQIAARRNSDGSTEIQNPGSLSQIKTGITSNVVAGGQLIWHNSENNSWFIMGNLFGGDYRFLNFMPGVYWFEGPVDHLALSGYLGIMSNMDITATNTIGFGWGGDLKAPNTVNDSYVCNNSVFGNYYPTNLCNSSKQLTGEKIGNIVLLAGSSIDDGNASTNPDPTQGGDIYLTAANKYYGTVLAANALLTINSDARVYGTVFSGNQNTQRDQVFNSPTLWEYFIQSFKDAEHTFDTDATLNVASTYGNYANFEFRFDTSETCINSSYINIGGCIKVKVKNITGIESKEYYYSFWNQGVGFASTPLIIENMLCPTKTFDYSTCFKFATVSHFSGLDAEYGKQFISYNNSTNEWNIDGYGTNNTSANGGKGGQKYSERVFRPGIYYFKGGKVYINSVDLSGVTLIADSNVSFSDGENSIIAPNALNDTFICNNPRWGEEWPTNLCSQKNVKTTHSLGEYVIISGGEVRTRSATYIVGKILARSYDQRALEGNIYSSSKDSQYLIENAWVDNSDNIKNIFTGSTEVDYDLSMLNIKYDGNVIPTYETEDGESGAGSGTGGSGGTGTGTGNNYGTTCSEGMSCGISGLGIKTQPFPVMSKWTRYR